MRKVKNDIHHEINDKILKPFLPNVFFPYLLKISKNEWFSDVFRGHKKRMLRKNGLNMYN